MHGDFIFVIYIYINDTYKWTKSNQEGHGLSIKTSFVTSLETHAIIIHIRINPPSYVVMKYLMLLIVS